jgi:DNA-binding MarR family transcriptional regulator/GNAT superfamily N-acetyltransferase
MDYLDPQIAAIRRFNRFYTQKLGALGEGLLDGPFSLTESRVLYELAYRRGPTAAVLARELALDTGYLSRILRSFEKAGLLERGSDPGDARRRVLGLSEKGRLEFARAEARSTEQAAHWLAGVPAPASAEVVMAMRTIERALGGTPSRGWVLRGLRPGDLGWVISRHGALYEQEFGWDHTFETLVAEIGAGILKTLDPVREAGWIAELDGVPVGSVFLVRSDAPETAKLRLLLVEPQARGLGIGVRLVEECERFARRAGYRRITLWTNSVLEAARRIYARAGYRLTGSEPYHGFGRDLVSETWVLELT